MEKMRGCLYVVAAPSGGGKTTLVNALLRRFDQLELSISHTTRPIRPNEVEGKNYYFVTESNFQAMVEGEAFLEHAVVYGYHYGTTRQWVFSRLEQGIDVILEIDWQGAAQVCRSFSSTVSIFIIPPSYAVLQERLKGRQQDLPETIAARMAATQEDIKHYGAFDYLLINDDFDVALEDMTHIVQAERLRCSRQRKVQAALLERLLGESPRAN